MEEHFTNTQVIIVLLYQLSLILIILNKQYLKKTLWNTNPDIPALLYLYYTI